MKADYPKTWAYLLSCKDRLAERERGTFGGEGWYGYVYPKNLGLMSVSKILTPSLGRRAEFSLDDKGDYFFVGSGGGGGGGYGIALPEDISLTYMLGLLNSRLLDWFIQQITTKFHSGWFAYNKQYIEQVPICVPQGKDQERTAKGIADRVERVRSSMASLRKKKLTNRERERLHREIEAHEERIDELVCELYGVDGIPS